MPKRVVAPWLKWFNVGAGAGNRRLIVQVVCRNRVAARLSSEAGQTLTLLNIAFAAGEGKKKATNMSNVQVEPGARGSGNWAIAVDGGTTNTRARLVHDGRIVATARRAVGVRDAVLTEGRGVEGRDFRATAVQGDDLRQGLRTAVAGAIAEVSAAIAGPESGQTGLVRPNLIAAAGMLTSEMGLVTVPHLSAPAGLDNLAARVVVHSIPEIADVPIAFVPGLKTPAQEGPDGWMWADVMRGEECETLGALLWLERLGSLRVGETEHVFVWPGSHTKLVEVDRLGRITRSHTSLAGELLAAVARHTLIAASLPPELPDQLDFEATEAGARAALGHGLGRAAFLVRIAALSEALNPEERAGFWIGAVVMDDVRQLSSHPILDGARPVWVGGREPLRALYARWLARFRPGAVTPLDDRLAEAASALGALEISARRVEYRQPGRSSVAEPAP
jgi:2-dehydro-3-deoxygalactonokinase